MSRIVVTAHGSLGDLYLLIGIALELRDRKMACDAVCKALPEATTNSV